MFIIGNTLDHVCRSAVFMKDDTHLGYLIIFIANCICVQ